MTRSVELLCNVIIFNIDFYPTDIQFRSKVRAIFIYCVAVKLRKMAAMAEGRMNLAALQQRDPYISDIVDTATQVALYTFSSKSNEWVSYGGYRAISCKDGGKYMHVSDIREHYECCVDMMKSTCLGFERALRCY